ncbi:MAG: hypothetical protein U1E65_04175 [Myxococcota bacterium]
MRRLLPLACLFAALACDSPRRSGGTHTPTATESHADASAERDAAAEDAAKPDAAREGMDAEAATDAEPVSGDDSGPFFFDAIVSPDVGFIFPDASAPDAGFVFPDASAPADAGFIFPDASAPADAGFVFPDASAPADAGSIFPDASAPPPPDAGTPRDAGFVSDAGTPSCSQDVDCPSGRCHPLYRQCVPAGQKLDCESCTQSSECGLPTDHCLHVSFAGGASENICAQGCSTDGDCVRGYRCSVAGHCYPLAGSIRPHTCASLHDAFAQKSCSTSVDLCGLPTLDDGTCMLGLNCTIGCNVEDDCPTGLHCADYIVAKYCVP